MCFSLGSEKNNNKVGIIDIAQAKKKKGLQKAETTLWDFQTWVHILILTQIS